MTAVRTIDINGPHVTIVAIICTNALTVVSPPNGHARVLRAHKDEITVHIVTDVCDRPLVALQEEGVLKKVRCSPEKRRTKKVAAKRTNILIGMFAWKTEAVKG